VVSSAGKKVIESLSLEEKKYLRINDLGIYPLDVLDDFTEKI